MGLEQKLSRLADLRDAGHIFEARTDTFLMTGPQKALPLKKMLFDQLDHHLDTLSIILSYNHWWLLLYNRAAFSIFAKNRKKKRQNLE